MAPATVSRGNESSQGMFHMGELGENIPFMSQKYKRGTMNAKLIH